MQELEELKSVELSIKDELENATDYQSEILELEAMKSSLEKEMAL